MAGAVAKKRFSGEIAGQSPKFRQELSFDALFLNRTIA